MEQSERRQLYEKALTSFGIKNQLWMVVEECGELLNAIGKMRRDRVTREDVLTELADVTIMCEQIAQFIGYEDYVDEMEHKLLRLNERLTKYEQGA